MSVRKVVTKQGLLVGLGMSMAVSTANAQQAAAAKKRDGRTVGDLLKRIEDNTKKVQFSKTKASLPQVQKLTKAAPVTHENLAQIKPPSRSSLYYQEGTNEAELEKITDQGINQLYKLTQQFKT